MLKLEVINNRYRILDFIGEGGMADIYLAEDLINNYKVAIKKLKKDNIQHIDINAKRFIQEAKLIANTSSSPHLIKVFDLFNFNDDSYIVIEYVEGKTLKKYLNERASIHYKEAINIALQICEGIKAIHSAKIVHRDIKPDNVLISKQGLIKVIDFGIAYQEGNEHITKDGNIIGSPQYLSPEAIMYPQNVTPQRDIYPIGIILYELITGSLPFSGNVHWDYLQNHVMTKVPLAKKIVPNIPTKIDYIIQKCTAKNLTKRYKNINEVITDLQSINISDSKTNNLIIEKIESFQKVRSTKKFKQVMAKRTEKELPIFCKKYFVMAYGTIFIIILIVIFLLNIIVKIK